MGAGPEENPFAPPTADPVARHEVQTRTEIERRAHLLTEAGVFAASLPFALAALIGLFGAFAVAAAIGDLHDRGAMAALVITFGFGAVGLGVALGLRRFHRWAQISAMLLALVLVVIPTMPFVLTIPTAVFVTGLLAHPKAWHVFTARYRDVVASTRHVKHRTPPWAWFAFAVVIAASLGYVYYVTRNLP